MDEQTEGTERQTDGWMHGWMDRQTNRQIDERMDRWTDRQTDSQIARQVLLLSAGSTACPAAVRDAEQTWQ